MTNAPTPVSLRGKNDPTRLAVTGVGNALLDIVARDPDETYRQHGFERAAMNLIGAERLEAVYNSMGPTIQTGGGSVANTIAGVAALGGTAGFIGKVARDEFGERFRHDLAAMGVDLDLTVVDTSLGVTGRCHVFVGDDAQRTMATHLGVANQLVPSDIREDLIARSEITFVEGYLYDLPPAKEAIARLANFAHVHESLLALSLSDSFCVDRHRRDFLELITNDVDVLLANEHEIKSLFQVDDLATAYDHLRDIGLLAVVTRGPEGADVLAYDDVVSVAAADVEHVVDQNGAGDLFAAGFLFGLALGNDPVMATELGSLCAGEVIKHYGARPEVDLGALALEAGLL